MKRKEKRARRVAGKEKKLWEERGRKKEKIKEKVMKQVAMGKNEDGEEGLSKWKPNGTEWKRQQKEKMAEEIQTKKERREIGESRQEKKEKEGKGK